MTLLKRLMSFVGLMLMPLFLLFCEYLFSHGWFKRVGVAACAASSSPGANVPLVMSGVTRQRFQNTAVNKVKVSRFAGRKFVFMSWTVHGWSNFSKQTLNLYMYFFFFLWIKKIGPLRLNNGYVFKQNYVSYVFPVFNWFSVFHRRNENNFWCVGILKCSFREQDRTQYFQNTASASHSP